MAPASGERTVSARRRSIRRGAAAGALAVTLAVGGLGGCTAARGSTVTPVARPAPTPATVVSAHRPADGRRRKPATPSSVFAGAVAAVPAAPPGWTITAHHLISGGLRRTYLVARPADPSPAGPLPILVVLHGRMLTPAAIERITGFLALVGRAVVVYPAGYDQSWNAGYCCGGAHRAAIDDVAFLRSVIRGVVATQPGTSTHDVYLVGYSNGGRMAYRMACADPGAFAGVAAVEAVAVSSCSGRESVPLIEVASTGDPLLAVDAGAPPRHIAGHTEETVAGLMAHWRALEGCRAGPASAVSGDVTTTEWAGCRGGSRIELAVYGGGSHAWPRGGPGTPSAQDLIWAFFRSAVHDRGAPR